MRGTTITAVHRLTAAFGRTIQRQSVFCAEVAGMSRPISAGARRDLNKLLEKQKTSLACE